MKADRRDIILGVILIGGALILAFLFHRMQSQDGVNVVVKRGGSVIASYPLHTDREVVLEEGNEKNVLKIQDGSVSMKEANCPDQYCVLQGSIRKSGETIVCLPHKLVIEISGKKAAADVDTVAQ